MACPRELGLAGDGGQRRKGKKRGSHDGGGSGPIYSLEGLEAKQMSSGGGRTGPEALNGEVAAGQSGAAHGGWRVGLPGGLELIVSEGAAS